MACSLLLLITWMAFGCKKNPNPEMIDVVPSAHIQGLISIAKGYETNYEIDSSLLIYNRVLQIVDSTGSEIDRVIVYGQIGKIYLYHKGNLLTSEDFLIKQRDLLESGNGYDIKWKINNYLDLSFLYFKKLDLPLAESYSMLAYAFSSNQNIDDSLLLSEVLTSIGNIKHQMLDSLQAIHFLKRAADYYPLSGDIKNMNHSWLVGLINYYNNFGPADSAIYWLNLMQLKSGSNIEELAQYERLFSIYYLLQDEYPESIQHARKSVSYFRLCKSPDPYKSTDAFVLLSASLQSAKQYSEALVFLDSALIKRFGEYYSLEDLKSDINSVSTLATKAEILGDRGIQLGDTSWIISALKIYDSLELLLNYFVKFDIDGFLINKYYNNFYYTKLMELNAFMYSRTKDVRWLYQIHNTIAAYKAQSFSRENTLFKLSKDDIGNDLSFKEFVKNDFALGKSIFEINSLSFADKLKRQYELNHLLREKNRIRNNFEKDHPEIYQRMIRVQNISPDQILDYSRVTHTSFVNYYIGDRFYNPDMIYVLLVVKGEFVFHVFQNNTQLFDDIDSLYLIHRGLLSQEDSFDGFRYARFSYSIYERVFEEFYDQLRDSKEVVIIPDEKLHHLAFDALIAEMPKNEPKGWTLPSDAHFLIDSLNISYAYSPNRFMKEESNPEIGYELSVLGMGFSNRETIRERKLEFLPELRSSYLELETIRKYHHDKKAMYFTGYECTKENFFRYAPVSRLIHLSTHGGYLSEVRNSGMLYMSKKRGVEKLYQHELRFGNICPEILVLSACDSGAGELNTEEGMMSIGRVFQAYGTKKVISALWPLTDKASTDLFNTFYSNYAMNMDANLALRKAKLKMLHSHTNHSFPGYWAGLNLYN